jgi:hypothetical protein
MGKKKSGYAFGFTWSTIPIKNGKFEITDPLGNEKGTEWVEGDSLCLQYETRYDGIKHCADIYKNPEGDEILMNEYFLLYDFWFFPFSIME